MAISQQNQEENPSSFLDELYCEEEKWDFEEFEEHGQNPDGSISLAPKLLENDMVWEDEELGCLFEKERKVGIFFKDLGEIRARKEAVKWMLRVNLEYGFSALTSILCVNYFDKCVAKIPFIQSCKPWTVQLAAVTCVSLAAKVEETHVPLILDLQVEGARPIFEPKDVQKMELLVLSTLEWKMHPVTPISFLDHIIRRLGLNNHHLHLEFLNKCELILLSLLPDWRFVGYLPSVLATSTMMHVIDQIQPSNALDYHSQLLTVLNLTKEKVKDCYELIIETLSGSTETEIPKSKRKFEQMMVMDNHPSSTTTIIPSSPNGVMDAYYFSSDSSNDSWAWGGATSDHAAAGTGGQLSVSSSVSSSPVRSMVKKGRVHEQLMPLQLPSLSRVFVDLIESPH